MKKPCKKCSDAGFDPNGESCGYCGCTLSSRHEHDHFPVPKRHGGEEVIPICLNCHDLKDRINFNDWNPSMAWRAIAEAPAEVKIFYGMMVATYWDFKAREEKLEEREAA